MSEQYKGIYGKIEFPPYQFKEYPKQITLADKTTKIVQNQREELALVAELGPDGLHQDPVVQAKIEAENKAGLLQAELTAKDSIIVELQAQMKALQEQMKALAPAPKASPAPAPTK